MGLDRFAQSRKTASLKVKREIENSHADSRKRRTTQKKAPTSTYSLFLQAVRSYVNRKYYGKSKIRYRY